MDVAKLVLANTSAQSPLATLLIFLNDSVGVFVVFLLSCCWVNLWVRKGVSMRHKFHTALGDQVHVCEVLRHPENNLILRETLLLNAG